MSTSGRTVSEERVSRVVRKVVFTVITGGIAYVITNIASGPADQIWAVTLSVFIGGVTLVVQFLVEFDNRLVNAGVVQSGHASRVEQLMEEKLTTINEATELFGLVEASALQTDVVTQLVRYSTLISPASPKLVYHFAQSELIRMSQFLKELGEGNEVTYDGEDRDWLLALTRDAESTIDAVSLATVDIGGSGFVSGGLWDSELGQRYLELQRDAVRRGIQVRRVFVLDRVGIGGNLGLLQICKLHASMGIVVRVLGAPQSSEARRTPLFDFILFDNEISYEVTAGSWVTAEDSRPVIVNTRLVVRKARVQERVQRFKNLWDNAQEFSGVA